MCRSAVARLVLLTPGLTWILSAFGVPAGPDGQKPQMSVAKFMGRARALLLNAGIIRQAKGCACTIRIKQN
jgi:hypothetical protein